MASTAPKEATSRRSRGQALVELAIISVVLALLFGTVLDFGRLFYAQITVENTARAGVLVAARAPMAYTGTCLPPAVETNLIGCAIGAESRGSGVSVAAAEVTVGCEDMVGLTTECQVEPQPDVRSRVTINKQFTFLMPLISAILGSSVTMTASVTADQESVPADAVVLPSFEPSASPSALPSALPSASPAPCASSEAPMPDLINGANDGDAETVNDARQEWGRAGFKHANFSALDLSNNDTVTSQTLVAGQCYDLLTATVTVGH